MSAAVLLNLIHTAALLLVFLGMIRLIAGGKRGVKTVFFAFAVACALLSNFYWLAYDVLRQGFRMPFAANEIGECAMFLLLGASLRRSTLRQPVDRDIIGTVLFTAANAALWIAWSGEWMQDILTGAAFGYFLCCLVLRIRQEDAFPVWEWRFLGIACVMLLAAQTAIFFVPEPVRHPLDLFCYFLLFSTAAVLLARALILLREDGQGSSALLCAFAAFAWTVVAMYMSEGGFYVAANLLNTLSLPMIYLVLRKEEAS